MEERQEGFFEFLESKEESLSLVPTTFARASQLQGKKDSLDQL